MVMATREFPLSEYARRSSRASPVGRMMAEFASEFRDGVDVNLGVGYVNEGTIPAGGICEAMRAVLGDPARYRLPFNYGSPAGTANLVASVRRFLLREAGRGLTPSVLDRCSVAVGPAGATSLLDGIAQVLVPGIVVTSDPMYNIYCEYLERRGVELVAVPEDDDGIRVDALEKKLAELGPRRADARFVYVVTVNNKYLSRTTGDAAIDGPAGARKPRVVYIPGSYCVHPAGELVEEGRRQLRISYGFEDVERLRRGIVLTGEAARYARGVLPSERTGRTA
jgi:DNA-binding transcriptional MocR family regulator